ncbi:flagellar biosynthesis regulator FlaF [Frigidibacter sp. MR17.24]|uniref:flagellar biosynthesis regulator FlaF n=1 Tax=Frigidibacter sp. MR17.24 TaxID=3127345 RepID=UPI00301313EA
MNATRMAKTAYSAPSEPVRTARGIEYEIFARVTGQLQRARSNGVFVDMIAALHENRRLWQVLASDLALPDNGLPDDLRARLLYLAEFTRQHSRKVSSGEAEAQVLIDINTMIMRGLRAAGPAT